ERDGTRDRRGAATRTEYGDAAVGERADERGASADLSVCLGRQVVCRERDRGDGLATRDGGKPIVPPERQHHTCVQGKRDGGRRRSRGQPLDGKRGRQQVRGGIENPDSRGAHHHV